MEHSFSVILSSLRRARGLNQRTAASELGISQALLSHYENGAREPGLNFVCRACDYYGVTADYILGRTDREKTCHIDEEKLQDLAEDLMKLAKTAQELCLG